jgi:hypothetical protein
MVVPMSEAATKGPQMGARGLERTKRGCAFTSAVVALAAGAAIAGCGGPSAADQAESAAKQLETAMVRGQTHAERQVSAGNSCITFNQQLGAYGSVASCTKECSSCAVKVGRDASVVRKAWNKSPSDVKSRYRGAYVSELAFLRTAKDFMKATANFARASGYAGADKANKLATETIKDGERFSQELMHARARMRRYINGL